MKNNYIKLKDGVYEVIPSESVAASRVIADFHEKLGRPTDPFSQAGEKMMELIISVWQDLYPQQYYEWMLTKREYQESEKSISEQVHQHTGRSLASIPTPIYKMMKVVFPNFKLDHRDDFLKLVQKYPYFRMANRI